MAFKNTAISFSLAKSSSDSNEKPLLNQIGRQTSWRKLQQWHRSQLSGWRSGVALSATAALIVMIVNIIFLDLAMRNSTPLIENGIGTLYDGSCSKVKNLGTWLHLAINILGTALLSASNYTQQCLVAPTRGEIDKTHAKGEWMDIGIPSLRNLRRISTRRLVLWLILGLSSVPLHLV